jgi:hypothetical protein
MSTRGQIKVEGCDSLLYRHMDSYPESMLPTLLPFVKEFYDRRGEDPDYMAARLLQRLMGDDKSFTGFGIGTGLHGDIEFLYEVKSGGTVVVSKGMGARMKKLAEFPLGTDPKEALARLK